MKRRLREQVVGTRSNTYTRRAPFIAVSTQLSAQAIPRNKVTVVEALAVVVAGAFLRKSSRKRCRT